jgi:hypothetical protein
MNLKQLDSFHKTRTGYLVFGLVELGLSYWFFSLAVNSGSLWQWTLTVILFVGFAQNFVKLIGTFIYGNKARRA